MHNRTLFIVKEPHIYPLYKALNTFFRESEVDETARKQTFLGGHSSNFTIKRCISEPIFSNQLLKLY